MKKLACVGLVFCCCLVGFAAVPEAPDFYEGHTFTATEKVIHWNLNWKGYIDVDHGGGNPGATVYLQAYGPGDTQWYTVQQEDIGAGVIWVDIAGPFWVEPGEENQIHWWRVLCVNDSGNPPLSSFVLDLWYPEDFQ